MKNRGSGYFIIEKEKWIENQEIADRRKRLLHFMVHTDYVGDEKDHKNNSGTIKKLKYRRCLEHNTKIAYLANQRIYNIKAMSLYYDAVSEERGFHQSQFVSINAAC